MPEWLPAVMGPGGGIIVFIIAGKIGFTFLTELIKKQDAKYVKQDARLDTLHTQIMEHISKQTVATSLQTEAIRSLTARLDR